MFYVDTLSMEIINCSDFSGYGKRFENRSFLNFSFGKASGARHTSRSAAARSVSLNRSLRYFNFHSFLSEAEGRCVLAARKLRSFIKSHASVIPFIALAAFVPFIVSVLLSFSEGFARRVDLGISAADNYVFLDSAMTDFAFERIGYFDTDGNVFSENGLPVSAKASFKEPVVFSEYTVRPGDTISGISLKFGLSNISTLIAVNKIDNVRSVRSGTKIRIPSVDGLVHTVSSGESLGSISSRYGVSIEDILDVNDMASDVLKTGSQLYIPGARLDKNTLRRAMGETFICPLTVRWRLTSKFGYRKDPFSGVDSHHTGIDMACPTGTSIRPAMNGTVAAAGFHKIYGNYVIIRHFDGYQTLYAHMSKILVSKGDEVSVGTKIGLVGSTGYSTGPHLHFSVYKNGRLVDPATVLK